MGFEHSMFYSLFMSRRQYKGAVDLVRIYLVREHDVQHLHVPFAELGVLRTLIQ
jgi:hypothetical protein